MHAPILILSDRREYYGFWGYDGLRQSGVHSPKWLTLVQELIFYSMEQLL